MRFAQPFNEVEATPPMFGVGTTPLRGCAKGATR
jgi:hypothetical protein